MLAYVFWHRPRAGIEASEYERRARLFHSRLDRVSACFHLEKLPFAAEQGYEDWYLVDDWSELGALNASAVTGERRAPHDSLAAVAGDGWGGMYALVRGEALAPLSVRWVSKPHGNSYEAFVDSLPAGTVWQRQLVLGPAPEFCLVKNGDPGEQSDPPARAVIHLSGTWAA